MIYARLIQPALRMHQVRLVPSLRRLQEVKDLRIVVDAPCLLMVRARFRLQVIAN